MNGMQAMRNRWILLIVWVFLCPVATSYAQDEDSVKEGAYHKITIVTANSLIHNSLQENTNGFLLVPTFCFNYDHFIGNKWGIGLHTDILLQQYKVESHGNGTELVRENPVALTAILSFRPYERWTLFGGYGVEIERNKNIDLFRFGLEYGVPLNDGWELGFALEYDHKIETYKSFMFGIGFSKLLYRK
jgi:opacity protein-like surface antigen